MFYLNKKLVTKEGLLKHIQDIDVYRFYTNQDITIGSKPIISPLRKEQNPSFGYFIGENNEVCFKDFVLGGGDFVKFVQLKFGLNYFEALSKIAIDFELEDYFNVKNIHKTQKNYNPDNFSTSKEKLLASSNKVNIGRKVREWTLRDLQYWFQYGIPKKTLLKYNVEPISFLFLNNTPIIPDKLAYSFPEFKDGITTYKIYQPFNKEYKWLTNHNSSVWQGWNQMPEKGEVLIITSSLKDCMSIVSTTNYSSVALQNEGITPKESVIDELANRFKEIYVLYDNDFDKDINWGKQYGQTLTEKHDVLRYIEIDDYLKSKDYSDLVKNIGIKGAEYNIRNAVESWLPF